MAGLGSHAAVAETAAETDPASLAQLHDIVTPAAVAPWWPLAPGWYLLGGILLLAAGLGLWRMRRRRRARRYRVEALAELHALRRHLDDPRTAAAGVLMLLKRTALAVYPRAEVANLSGTAWWRFLDLTGGKPRFGEGLGELAAAVVYAQHDVDSRSKRNLKRLYRAAEQWIRRHRPPVPQSVPGVAAVDKPAAGA